MTNFTTILTNTTVATSQNGVTMTHGFQNIAGTELLAKLRNASHGIKDGSHFLRTALKHDDAERCLARADVNAESLASIIIIDCDKRIDINTGEELEGAPDPYKISDILRSHNIGHLLYGSHSHYVGNKGNRYRIVIPTLTPYNKAQLAPTIESVISLINIALDTNLLVNSKENNAWSQPWYYPRKPASSTINDLYIDYLEGNAIDVVEPIILPPIPVITAPIPPSIDGEISPIAAFNEQYPLIQLLNQYGYKFVYTSNDYQKWIRPNSTSHKAGITVNGNKFYSHHNDQFNDGYWHDAFDLMRISEGLSNRKAIIKAAQSTIAPHGSTIDEDNKSLANRKPVGKNVSTQPMPHTEILDKLFKKIPSINFRKRVKLEENDQLKYSHFQIIAIETILATAKQNNWGLCRNHDFIYLYNSAYWNLLGIDDLKSFLGNAAEKMGIDKFIARHFNFRDQLYKQFLALAHLPKPDQPKDIVFVNLKNGTFEITPKGTRLKQFTPDDFITYQLPFEYNENAQAPLFQQYLDRVLPDRTLQMILSECIGYVFIRPSTLKLEKTLLLYGKGANGKSVFYEVIRNLLGEQNTSEYSLQSLTNENGYFRAMIANKLVNYASEISGKLGASIFKQLVSGEPVEARLPHGKPFIMTDYAKLIFNCNELPKDVEQTEAYFRRFLIIPFNVTIPEHEQDKQLSRKIINAELSGVFNWVLDGLKRLLVQKHFTDSKVIHDICTQYEKESDSVKLFLDDMEYISNTDSYVSMKVLYPEYQHFCIDNGYKPVSSLNFRKRLEHSNIIVSKKNIGNVAFVSKSNGYSQASGR